MRLHDKSFKSPVESEVVGGLLIDQLLGSIRRATQGREPSTSLGSTDIDAEYTGQALMKYLDAGRCGIPQRS